MVSVAAGLVSMGRSAVTAEYARCLFWIALGVSLTCGLMNITELLFVDFVHGNPHRAQSNAIQMMIIFTPLLAVTGFLGVLLVFGVAQWFQARLAYIMMGWLGVAAHPAVLVLLPLTAAITWYCYDYLTPSNCNLAIKTPADWTPYQHGITWQRYLFTLALQTPISLFNCAYSRASGRRNLRRILLVALTVLAICAGCLGGYRLALNQYLFL